MLDKKALRKEIGAKKRAMSENLIQAYSQSLTAQFLETEFYQKAQSLYVYLPYNQEVRTWDIIRRAWADGKKVAVPKVYGDTMKFLWLSSFESVAPGAWDIPEPTYDEPEADDETALILMPGLAFDREGHRMGYGGGFYDRYLEQHTNHSLVALCYPFQLLPHLKTETHDVPVQRVIAAKDHLKLVPPCEEYLEQFAAYRRAFIESGDSMDGTASLMRMENPRDWLAQCNNLLREETTPEKWVPMNQYMCVREEDQKIVGMIQIRRRLNEFLAKYAGHIGYSVHPQERKKGYAKWMLKNLLPICKEIGLERVMLSCADNNPASRSTILANGGVYESTVYCEAEDVRLERYWIDL